MRTLIKLLLVILALGWLADQAEAQRRGRGGGSRGGGFRGGFGGGGGFRSAGLGGGFARAGSRPSITARPSQLPARHFSGASVSRPDVGRPGRPDIGQPGRPDIGQPGRPDLDNRWGYVDRDVYVDRDFDVDDDWWDWDDRYDGCCYYPVARAAAWGAAAAATSYGSYAYTLPSDCVATVINGITYYQCGSTYYQPQFSGTTVQYVAVSPPR